MFCANCGCELTDDAAFCPQCGTRRPEAPATGSATGADSGEPMLAGVGQGTSQARAVVEPTIEGAPASPQTPLPTQMAEAAPQPKKRSSKGLVIGIVGAACAIVVIAVAVFAFANPFAKQGVNIKDSFADTSLVELVSRYDADQDGVLAEDEVKQVQSLDLSGTGVASLEGIQYLTELNTIDVSNCANLTTIALPALPKLESVDARGSGATTVQAGECPLLGNLQVDDKVEVEGLEGPGLQESWLLVGFQYTNGYEGPGTVFKTSDTESGSFEASYDDRNRISSLAASYEKDGKKEAATVTYQYDDDDRLVVFTDDRGEAKSLTYDDEGRPLEGLDQSFTKSLLRPSATHYQYGASKVVESDEYGKMTVSDDLIVARDGGLHWTFSYDEKRRVKEDSGEFGPTTFQYDDQGNLVKIDKSKKNGIPYIDDFSYDDKGNIIAASRTFTKEMYKVAVDLKFDEHGNVVSRRFTYPNGTVSTTTFNYRRIFADVNVGEPTNVLKLVNPLEGPEVMAVPLPVAFPDSPRIAAREAYESTIYRK